MSAETPAIVLVRPQLGENIGKAARAMLNFGLTDLRLVAPRDGWPNPDAGPAASGADAVLAERTGVRERRRGDRRLQLVYATTVRKRGLTKQVVGPETAARDSRARGGSDRGPVRPRTVGPRNRRRRIGAGDPDRAGQSRVRSLNLAQAVILFAYEWSKAEVGEAPAFDNYEGPAPQDELEGFIAQLGEALDAAGYFARIKDRAPSTRRALRNILTRPGFSAKEVRTLRGVVTALTKERR